VATTRNYFSYTVIKANPALNNLGGDAVLTSLAGVTWDAHSLNAAGSPSSTNVYTARSNGIASTGGVTDYNGVIEFWAEPGEYQISISDPSARISDKEIFWSSVSGQEGGIPGTSISTDDKLESNQIKDGTIATADIGALQVTNAKLAADSVTTAKIADLQVTGAKIADNVLPLGSVIDWYRVTSGTFVPTGWAVCDGSLWNDIDNQMGASKAKLTTGNIPNLIGKVTVGARLTVASGGSGGAADGIGSTNGDVWGEVPNYYPPSAPGIGGIGGSNAAINLAHTHTVAGHSHGFTLTASGANANVTVNGGYTGISFSAEAPGTSGQSANHVHGFASNETYAYNFTTGTASTGSFTRLVTPSYSYAAGQTNNQSHDHSHTVNNHGHGYSDPGHGHGITQTAHTHTVTGTVGTAGTSGDSAITTSWFGTSGVLTDFRPAHVGLLKIMKVKIV
jgi:hypothetical protein